MMIYRYKSERPQIGKDVFIAPGASVIGRVRLGDQSSVWHGAVLRGDVGPIVIGDRTNLQDCTVVHVTAGAKGTTIGSDVVIGHRALIHECTVEDYALIGMGAILLDGCVIGRGAIIAAGAVVRENERIPAFALVAGIPATVRRILPEDSLEARRQHAQHYVQLANEYRSGQVEPL
jgi:carbonic anhydrase/acetyltransferase-like protein (isoleucine patch superfamily)